MKIRKYKVDDLIVLFDNGKNKAYCIFKDHNGQFMLLEDHDIE